MPLNASNVFIKHEPHFAKRFADHYQFDAAELQLIMDAVRDHARAKGLHSGYFFEYSTDGTPLPQHNVVLAKCERQSELLEYKVQDERRAIEALTTQYDQAAKLLAPAKDE